MKEFLLEIYMSHGEGKDLLVDELGDRIENGQFGPFELEQIATEMIRQTYLEKNEAFRESVFNLLSSLYEKGICRAEIENVCIDLLSELSPGCLVHAIPVLAMTERDNVRELLKPFLESENSAVLEVAKKYFDD